MSQLADLWRVLSTDTAQHGDCTAAALVLADALQEVGDPRGDLVALAIAGGCKATCPTNGDVEAQRLMRASHSPNDMLREHHTGRWHKRRRHRIFCDNYRDPRRCNCDVHTTNGQPLFKEYRQLDSGAWTWENIYTAAEPDGYVRLSISFDEFEAWEAIMLARAACALAEVPFNNDTLNHCRAQLRLDWRPMSATFIAYRVAGYLGNNLLAGKLLEQAQLEQKAQLEWLRGSYQSRPEPPP